MMELFAKAVDSYTIMDISQGPKYASVNCENVIGFEQNYFSQNTFFLVKALRRDVVLIVLNLPPIFLQVPPK